MRFLFVLFFACLLSNRTVIAGELDSNCDVFFSTSASAFAYAATFPFSNWDGAGTTSSDPFFNMRTSFCSVGTCSSINGNVAGDACWHNGSSGCGGSQPFLHADLSCNSEPEAPVCPLGSTGTYPACTCGFSYTYNSGANTCNNSAPTAGDLAAQAAAAAGYDAGAQDVARQAADDAIAAGRSPQVAALVGDMAARVLAAGGTVNQALQAALTAGSSQYYAGTLPAGPDPVAACNQFAAAANQIGTYDPLTHRCTLSAGTIIPLTQISPIELGSASPASPSSEPEPLVITVVGAGAYETSINAGLSPQEAMELANLAEQGVLHGMTPAEAQAYMQAGLNAMIAQNSDILAVQYAAALAAAQAQQSGAGVTAQQAAATAAANVIQTGGTSAQAQAAGQTAAAGVQSGLSPAAAVTAAGNTGTSTGGATEITLQKVLNAVNGLSGSGTSMGTTLDNILIAVRGLGDFGDVPDIALGVKSIDVAIVPVEVSSNAACPAATPMYLHNGTYYFEWTTYCNFADGIRPILLAFAWLAAAGILIGGFKT